MKAAASPSPSMRLSSLAQAEGVLLLAGREEEGAQGEEGDEEGGRAAGAARYCVGAGHGWQEA